MTHRTNQQNPRTRARRGVLALVALLAMAFAFAPSATAEHSDEDFEEGCAVTPGGWGAEPAGNNPGSVLHDHFDEVFPDGFDVGDEHFAEAQDVTDEVPRSDAPLFNHAVALTINLAFGNAGHLDGSLAGVVADSADYGDFTGLTAEELLQEANDELSDPGLSNDERSNLIDAITALNEEREGCNPVPPSDLVCVALENGVNQLTWEYNGDELPVFRVYRATDGENFTLIGSTTMTSFNDTSAVPETTYQYFVTAVVDGDESAPSNVCEVTAIPFFPTLVGAVVALAGTLALVGTRGRFRKP